MEPKLDHITFRPGDLLPRLTNGPLASGTKAKRDLTRYYRIVDRSFADWWTDTGMDEDLWVLVSQFVHTRSWRLLPEVEDFIGQLEEFLDSVLALGYPKVFKTRAMRALDDLTYAELVAILDRAQDEIRAERAVAIGGATSAAS